ncbi:hypothetical protein RvY_07336 [Ramazzottius varieornatus]|uniref:Ubiquitin-like domain-containing protein n=1 Tax=Ramazzottius varieornatus TaxID=947166 RepID=A0A1D1V1R8_RAMVA|nr:hypothetical protein RvY_07336 [Ramazzottius varieornatus]
MSGAEQDVKPKLANNAGDANTEPAEEFIRLKCGRHKQIYLHRRVHSIPLLGMKLKKTLAERMGVDVMPLRFQYDGKNQDTFPPARKMVQLCC